MFRSIRKIFTGTQKQPIDLRFEMDIDDQGNHHVTIKKCLNNHEETVNDIDQLLALNYYEEVEQDHQTTIYYLGESDRQKILSLKSLNPEITSDGSLSFEIEPPVLNYLRKKDITETEKSKEVIVLDNEIKPTACVSYQEEAGVTVNFGYRVDEAEPVKPVDELKMTRDGQYARIGNKFVPLARTNEKTQELLDKKIVNYKLDQIPEFFQRDLVMIQDQFEAVLTDLAGKVQIFTDPMKPVVSVKKDPQGWLDFDVKYSTSNYELPKDLLFQAIENNEEYVQLDPITWVKVDEQAVETTKEKLEALEASLTEDGYRIPASEFASLEEFIDAIGGDRVLDKAYKEFLEQLSGFAADTNYRLTERFEKHLVDIELTLRPYQRAGIHWLDWLRNNQLHGILADDMGLGKTIQSLSVLRLAYEETGSKQHSLVIAPKSVLLHWEREIRKVFGFFRTYVYHGSNRKQRYFKSSLPYIFITTYGTVLRDAEELAKVPFHYLILDEASKIKNPDAKRSQAIKSLNARHRIALSGTPVENRPSELWSLFDFLMKGHLGRYGTFTSVFESSIMAGNSDASQKLGRRIKPFLMRRKKEDVAADLPPKIIIPEWVNLTDEQRDLYAGMQDQVKKITSALQRGDNVNYTTTILPVITKLKQICDHPALVTGKMTPIMERSEKFDAAIEKIEDIIDNDEKVIVFSHFLGMLSLIENVMIEKGISYIRIDGSTNKRQELIDEFNQGKAKVAILSLMAASYGINLTAANHVIHVDRWWNPAVEDQATDRVHRIGQNKTVFVYHLIVEGTLEEKIDRLLERKRNMADQIVNAAVSGESKWSRDDLMEILKPLD